MRIDILTLFPEMFAPFIQSSILGRARNAKAIEIEVHDFRLFSKNRHSKVDDTVYGGGAGMLISVEPIVECMKQIKGYESAHKILLTPVGTTYTQSKAQELAKKDHIIIICGHYEGIDARINNYIDEMISIGDFVLTGGEACAIMIADSVARLVEGVISADSIVDETFNNHLLEYDQYTKPANYDGYSVPDVLMSGNHEEIRKWRLKNSLEKTYKYRPDLLESKTLTKEEEKMLSEIKK